MIIEIIKKWCVENDIEITNTQLTAFEKYAELLILWNQKMNLTAITDKKEIAVKHFIDSISVLKSYNPPQNSKLIDIGTGAGFPGIPLKIMRPDIELCLLDSLNKRITFLKEVCREIKINVELIHGRAEEYGQNPQYRESFDTVVSRAVANLPSLCEYCIPYLKTGGSFISMKGPDGENELKLSKNAIKLLGGKSEQISTLTLPDNSVRVLIEIKKILPTPSKYPRRGVKISKSPL